MNFPDSSIEQAKKRLARAEGQVRAVQRMLDDGASCQDVITQLSAAIGALEQAGFRLVLSALTDCLSDESNGVEDDLIAQVEKMFLRLS